MKPQSLLNLGPPKLTHVTQELKKIPDIFVTFSHVILLRGTQWHIRNSVWIKLETHKISKWGATNDRWNSLGDPFFHVKRVTIENWSLNRYLRYDRDNHIPNLKHSHKITVNGCLLLKHSRNVRHRFSIDILKEEWGKDCFGSKCVLNSALGVHAT